MATERWRLFVAVPISDDLRRNLAAAVEEWKQRPDLAGLRWTDPASWHVTLAFIGPVEASAVPGLVERVTDVAATHHPMHLRTGGVRGFPSAARSRVAWHGIDDDAGRLAAVATDVRHAVDVDAAVAFRGHITLARSGRAPVDLRAWVREAGAPVLDLTVDRMDLMRSHLGRGLARYEVLKSMQIGAVVRS
jgi:RNA 2',3'-cyclic 3'-phosphodiesterase